MKDLTYPEWAAVLEHGGNNHPEALTTVELAEKLGCSRDKALKLLKHGVHKGWVTVVIKNKPRLDGYVWPTTAYIIKQLPAAASKKSPARRRRKK
jgi:hypothetical protein